MYNKDLHKSYSFELLTSVKCTQVTIRYPGGGGGGGGGGGACIKLKKIIMP